MSHSSSAQFTPPELSKAVTRARYFFLGKPIKTAFSLAVICGGREQCNPDYSVNRKDFPYFGLEWVESGAGTVELNGNTFPLRAGTVFCYGPKTSCKIITDPNEPMTKVFLDFTGSHASRLLKEVDLPPGAIAWYPHITELSELLSNFSSSVVKTSTATAEVGALYLRLILEKIRFGRADPGKENAGADYETYRRCRYFIQEHASELRSLRDAAKKLGVSPGHICRLFSRFGPSSPYQFLLSVKMNQVLEPLSKRGSMVKEVAFASGYTDPNHFSRLFKKVHGIYPTAMQRLLQREER